MARRLPPFVHKIQQQNPQRKVEVWFQDEARIGQQGTITSVWADKGTRPISVKQTEYEWLYLFGAVNPVNGNSAALIAPMVNTDYMNHHLRFISEQAGQKTHVVLVLDQAGWHTAKNLIVPENVTLLYLPAYSPELNPVERLWAYLKSHYLSNRIYENYRHLFETTSMAWNNISAEQLKTICNVRWIMHEN